MNVAMLSSRLLFEIGLLTELQKHNPAFKKFSIKKKSPLLIVISAVSFTISYYSLYVLPKFSSCATGNSCECGPTDKEKRKTKITKAVFWIGLILSIGFLSYFEYIKYQIATTTVECTQSECGAPEETSSCSDTTACDGKSCGE
jgi:hypothetical protein